MKTTYSSEWRRNMENGRKVINEILMEHKNINKYEKDIYIEAMEKWRIKWRRRRNYQKKNNQR